MTFIRSPRPPRVAVLGLGAACCFSALPLAAAQAAGAPATIAVSPADSVADALGSAGPGDTVLLRNGDYPLQWLTSLALPGVTLRGESRSGVTVHGLVLKGVSGLSVSDLTVVNDAAAGQSAVRLSDGASDIALARVTIRPTVRSGLDIWAGSARISLTDSVVDGSGVPADAGADSRGVRINGAPYYQQYWPTDITLRGNDISGFTGDLVQIVGGERVLVQGNRLHDPQPSQTRNNGIQSVGSDAVTIEDNRFSAPGPAGEDQAVKLGAAGIDSRLRVTGTVVRNNVITAWRGDGISLHGTTGTVVVNNSVAPTGTPATPGAALAVRGTNDGLVVANNVLDSVVDEDPTPLVQKANCVRVGGTSRDVTTSDPQYADRTTLALALSSPCRKIGDPTLATPTAIDGTPRGSLPDAGAWQAVSTIVRHITPTDSLVTALTASQPGDVVELAAGTYPLQKLTDLTLTGVTLRGASQTGTVVQGFALKNVAGLAITNLTVANEVISLQSAVRVSDGSHDIDVSAVRLLPKIFSGMDVWAGTSHITLRDSTVIGTGVKGLLALNSTSRGVRINGAPYGASDWPTDIDVLRNDISGFGSDLIQIAGGRRVLVQGNFLHDPQFTPDHNDGVQSVGSDQLTIDGNRFFAPGPNGPDQGVMLGQPDRDPLLKVTNTRVVNNLVVTWRGTGFNLAGSANTTIVNNTVGSTGQGIGSSVGLHGANPGVLLYNNVLDKLYNVGSSPLSQWDNCTRWGGGGTGLVSGDLGLTSDLHLLATSRCRASADPHGAPPVDMTGKPRGSAPDRGAYQS